MLTDTRIRQAKPKEKAYKMVDAKGLFLHVLPSGSKVWRYAYIINGKANCYTIGTYTQPGPGHTTIDIARSERARCRALVVAGVHPKADRDQQKAVKRDEDGNTFESIAREMIERGRKGLASGKPWSEGHADKMQTALERYVFKKIGALPIRTIGAHHIREIMDDVVALGFAGTAIEIRQWCGATFSLACMTGRADTDPTYALRRYVARPKVKHKTPLTRAGIKTMREKIETTGFPTTQLALRLLMRLFVRPGELRCAEWSEFDLGNACWIIPGTKMKKGAEFRVPLSTQAVAELRELHAMTGGDKYLFPNFRTKGTPMAECTMNQALHRIGYTNIFSAHGFRATFSTQAHELDIDPKLIEFALSHASRNQTAASYNQAQYWTQRKELAQQWSDLLDVWIQGDGDNVIPFKSKAA